jgi:uncharacterized surface protein with fasciclin (FAS1) repeats
VSCARIAILSGVLSLTLLACGGSNAGTATSTTQTPPSTTTSISVSTTVADTGAASTTVPATSTTAAPTKTILELVAADGSFTTLLHLLDVAGLTPTLEGTGPFTLMAPTDAAFAKMDPTTLQRFTDNPDVLKSLLQYHLVASRLTPKDVTAGSVLSVEGSSLALQSTSGLPSVNGLSVSRGARATNGLILVVGSVLLPVDLKLP